MQCLSKLLRVDEYNSLSHLAHTENFLHEFWFLALFAAEFKLLNMIELQMLFLDADLLSMSDESRDIFLNFVSIGSTEEYVLDFLFQFRKVLCYDFSQCLKIACFFEENICLVNHYAPYRGQIKCWLSALQCIVKLPKGSDDNMSSF